jgi:hypothetical protein
MRASRAIAGLALCAALPACKDSTGPSLAFPTLPAAALAEFCVRGEKTVNGAISGTIAVSDCPFGDGSFFESWRLRVASAGAYRFTATSTFDNVLLVVRLDSIVGDEVFATTMAFDDDSGPDTNALIASVTLQPNVDYFLVVNGFDAGSVGPYTATFATAP